MISVVDNCRLSNQYLSQNLSNLLQNKYQYWPIITTKSHDFAEFIEYLNEFQQTLKKKRPHTFNDFKSKKPHSQVNPKSFSDFDKSDLLNDQDKIQILKIMSMSTFEIQINQDSLQ